MAGYAIDMLGKKYEPNYHTGSGGYTGNGWVNGQYVGNTVTSSQSNNVQSSKSSSSSPSYSSGNMGTMKPYTVTTTNPEYSKYISDYYKQAETYQKELDKLKPELKSMVNYYKPGGGYGQGQRTEAAKTVKSGVAKDMGSLVASGMSSNAGARGLQTRASAELSTQYKNIEDTRNQLWQQSYQPYLDLLNKMQSNLTQSSSFMSSNR